MTHQQRFRTEAASHPRPGRQLAERASAKHLISKVGKVQEKLLRTGANPPLFRTTRKAIGPGECCHLNRRRSCGRGI